MSLIPWRCANCGEEHRDVPLDFATDRPYAYEQLDAESRERAHLTTELCVIDNRWFFVRGVIEVPILGSDLRFRWGTWCSVSEKSHRVIYDNWDHPDLDRFPPVFGWLNTRLPLYPDTLNMKVSIQLRSGNRRPVFTLEPTEHPLALEQRCGISVKRLYEMLAVLLHPPS